MGCPASELLMLVFLTAATRFFFRSHLLYDLDSVNFALGLERFDPRVHQPHPPGYFLYVCLGRLLNLVFHDANLSFVVLGILASCGAILLVYRMAEQWFGLSAARFAALLFLLSPLGWFYGTVALTYSVEGFFSALLGYFCWRIDHGEYRLIPITGVVLGISAGVRPSSLLLLGPLFLFSVRRAGVGRRITGVAVLLATIVAWWIPMVWASGGLHVYFEALFSLWRMVPAKGTVFNSSPATSIARACTIAFIYVLAFGVASLAPLALVYRKQPAPTDTKRFTAAWMLPALCFFTFVFLKFVNSGYLLLLLPPACLWLGYWLSEWYRTVRLPGIVTTAIFTAGAAANVLLFLFGPVYCSYRSVRQFESQMEAIQRALPDAAPAAGRTVILSFDSHFLGFRHAGYYLPGYLTLEYPEAHLTEGTRIFAMNGRETQLLSALPANSGSQFIVFPLPHGPAFEQYTQMVFARVPKGSLRTIHADGYDFIAGPASDLHLLFPSIADGEK